MRTWNCDVIRTHESFSMFRGGKNWRKIKEKGFSARYAYGGKGNSICRNWPELREEVNVSHDL